MGAWQKTCKSKRCSIKDDTQCKDPRYYHPYSCLNRCNEAKDRAYSLKKCFCDPKCLQFGDCCNDFLTQCVPKACKVKFKEWLGDGKCESSGNGHGEYNTAECFWDGGDCCKDTCNSTGTEYACGSAAIGYECKQPGQCAVKEIQRVGNGLCDNDFNTKTCSWDGSCVPSVVCARGGLFIVNYYFTIIIIIIQLYFDTCRRGLLRKVL